ncbi:MAG TPA: tetratricopeptide repeat protein [Ktedonobacteraceae bacterium]|nr:tetratricopeptide repeat protein [Ktedonobacteraceae bacterium]
MTDDPFQWNETIGELLKYALVRRSREQQALSIHRLVQTVLRDALDQPIYRQWTEQTIRAVERVFPSGIDPANWVKCKLLLPHAQVCAILIERHDLSSEEAANLLHRMASYLYQHARYSEAEPLFLRTLWIWERNLGPDHPQVASPLNNLANLYREQGKHSEAEPLYLRALRIWERNLGHDHSLTRQVRNNYAIFL